ncbi:hypothetical protein CHS0354_008817, partial [Potamilus streckersoni]
MALNPITTTIPVTSCTRSMKINNVEHIKETASVCKSKSKLLITYGIFIPESGRMSNNGEKDAVSVEILKMYPAFLRDLVSMY